jgi:hypothetical protein
MLGIGFPSVPGIGMVARSSAARIDGGTAFGERKEPVAWRAFVHEWSEQPVCHEIGGPEECRAVSRQGRLAFF